MPELPHTNFLPAIIALIFLAIGSYTDLKYRNISNYVSLGMIVTGLTYNVLTEHGCLFSLTGIVAGFALFLLPYIVSGMGAGDVKLMMGVGAVMGWQYAIYIGILSSILAALYAVIIFSRQGRISELFNTTISQANYAVIKVRIRDYSRELTEGKTIPYAASILISTIMILLWGWL